MGSPLGPALANIFVGYYEKKLFSQTQKPSTYFRYVDDTFAIFNYEAEADEFLTKLNCLHPPLKFTFEKEEGKCLRFLDVFVEKTDIGFETSVYRKPTFTGQHLRWESFSPLKRKTSLTSTLVHRGPIICTKRRLNGEIERIKKKLLDNGYPKNVINAQITKKLLSFPPPSDLAQKSSRPLECPLDWQALHKHGKRSQNRRGKLLWFRQYSLGFYIKAHAACGPQGCSTIPTTQKSFVMHEYKCHGDSRYVGRTSQQLQNRIKQHVPQWLRQQLTRPRRSQPHRSCKRNDTKPDCDAAIGQHVLDNDQCALNYDNKRFSILATARSSFHRNLLEVAYIKNRRTVLCKPKEFVYALKLFR